MKRGFRWLTWALSPFLFYFGLAVFGALIPASSREVGDAAQRADHWIVLIQGPIHYDILLPLDDDTRATFGFLTQSGVPVDAFNSAWLSVGWGSQAFYTTAGSYRDITLSAVARAATGDDGVLRFEVYGPLPDYPELRRVRVTRDQLGALRASIRADLGAVPTALPLNGFSQTDAFYRASGRFHVLRTCNVWVGTKLAQAGLDFGIWTPTPYAVTLSLWWNSHLERQPSER